MSSRLDREEIPRRTMVLFFIVDTSGSMSGSKIGAVNAAIHEVLPELKDISENNADALIKIAALEFSSGAKWLWDNPIESDSFRWNDLNASGITDLGEACKLLNQKLSIKEGGFMQEAVGSFAPVLFLLSDGEPTDNYEKELANLKANKWFEAATKIAIAIGEDANQAVLEEFTGHSELVLSAYNPEQLKKLIKFVSVRASQVQSQSSTGDKTKVEELIEKVKNAPDISTASSATSGDINIDDW